MTNHKRTLRVGDVATYEPWCSSLYKPPIWRKATKSDLGYKQDGWVIVDEPIYLELPRGAVVLIVTAATSDVYDQKIVFVLYQGVFFRVWLSDLCPLVYPSQEESELGN